MVMEQMRANRYHHHLGALSELRVAVDLMLQGYEVFRAISGFASCDLIAIRGTETKRVEVKTLEKLPKKKYSRSQKTSTRADIFAACSRNGQIAYKVKDEKEATKP